MKILLLALPYHNYTDEIIKELEQKGHFVKYFPIKPRKLFHKVLQTISYSLFQRYLNNFHKKVIKQEQANKYDLVLFIQVHFISFENFEFLKKTQKQAKFILYNWDSINTHDYRPYSSMFNKVATFDPTDANNLNIDYLPLFCIKSFQNLSKSHQKKESIYFIGNIVTVQRYAAIKKFKEYCKSKNISFQYYLKCTPVKYLKLLTNGYLPLDVKLLSIQHKKMIKMMEESSVVFDFPNHIQSGYTMRFMENLCAGKKIITTNKNVLKEDFYSSDRILLLENLEMEPVEKFIYTMLNEPQKIFKEYHLSNFIENLLKI